MRMPPENRHIYLNGKELKNVIKFSYIREVENIDTFLLTMRIPAEKLSSIDCDGDIKIVLGEEL